MAYITLSAMDKLKIGYALQVKNSKALVMSYLQDHMERFWSNSIFKYLRVEPEDHYFLLTEPVCPHL